MAYIAESSEITLTKIENVFNESIKTCYELFGKYAFEKHSDIDDLKRKRKSATLFEVWMVSVAKLECRERELLVTRKKIVKDKFIDLIADEEFSLSISLATQKHDHVKIRYNKIKALIEEVLND